MMKSVRSTIVIMTITIFAWLSLGSCDRESQTQIPEQSTEESAPSHENIPKAVIDSISNFKAELETISKESRNAVEIVDNMKVSITKMQGKEIWLWGAIILIAVLTFILFGISHKLYSNLQDRANRQRSDIEELRRYDQDQSFAPSTAARTSVPSNYEILKYKVLDLEMQVRQLTSFPRPIKQPQTTVALNVPNVAPSNPTHAVRRHSIERNGFFGLPTQKSLTEAYFKRLTNTRESDSYFTVIVRDNNAEFRLIEGTQYLNEIKSNDDIKMALEFEGCAPSEAAQMKVILPGEAQKDGDRWIITKKATITLYR